MVSGLTLSHAHTGQDVSILWVPPLQLTERRAIISGLMDRLGPKRMPPSFDSIIARPAAGRCVSLCACVRARAGVRAGGRACVRAGVRMCACECVRVCVRVRACMCECVRACGRVCARARVCVRACARVSANVCVRVSE